MADPTETMIQDLMQHSDRINPLPKDLTELMRRASQDDDKAIDTVERAYRTNDGKSYASQWLESQNIETLQGTQGFDASGYGYGEQGYKSGYKVVPDPAGEHIKKSMQQDVTGPGAQRSPYDYEQAAKELIGEKLPEARVTTPTDEMTATFVPSDEYATFQKYMVEKYPQLTNAETDTIFQMFRRMSQTPPHDTSIMRREDLENIAKEYTDLYKFSPVE